MPRICVYTLTFGKFETASIESILRYGPADRDREESSIMSAVIYLIMDKSSIKVSSYHNICIQIYYRAVKIVFLCADAKTINYLLNCGNKSRIFAKVVKKVPVKPHIAPVLSILRAYSLRASVRISLALIV
jgi:hypothetical protein